MFEFDIAGKRDSSLQRSAAAGSFSLAIHAGAVVIIWLLLVFTRAGDIGLSVPAAHVGIELPRLVLPVLKPSGGGGGGEHNVLLVSRGEAPRSAFTRTFIAPVPVTNSAPKLAVEPTLLNAEAPKIDAVQYGDPLSESDALSFGSGVRGMGSGGRDGLGPGDGNGYRGGSGGNMGDSFYRPGNGVSAPTLLSKVEPEYSDEARRAKFSGTVALRIIVDEHGIPRGIKVTGPLGLGLDERAIEAVRHWRFKPGMKNGKPVAVEASIEVSFRLL